MIDGPTSMEVPRVKIIIIISNSPVLIFPFSSMFTYQLPLYDKKRSIDEIIGLYIRFRKSSGVGVLILSAKRIANDNPLISKKL